MTRPVVGIDLSLTATGIAAVGGLSTIKSGSSGDTIIDRLVRLGLILEQVRQHVSTTPAAVTLVLVEGPSLGQQRQGGEHLRAGLWWLLMDRLNLWGHHPVDVPPATLKKFATGKGNATKADMRMALFQRGGLDVRDDNQVDAWWLRQVGLHLLDDPTAVKLPKTHLDALAKMKAAT
jgi:crossover junction endodeoxyribonuclease RuvC